MKVKAYAAASAGAELKPFEYELGPIGLNQVDIKVESCGICHSDLSMLDNEWGFNSISICGRTRSDWIGRSYWRKC